MAPKNAHALTIGIDFGGTNLRIAAYTAEQGILQSIATATRLEAGPPAVVDDMCAAVLQLLNRYGATHQLAGIGVGSPGPLELPAGRLHRPPNLPGWDGFQLLKAMERCLRLPVVLESDANVAVLAEYKLGLGRELGVDSLCMLTLGTGVGNGIILEGKLWHGAAGMGGEAGHMTIEPEGTICGCGNRGCLEVCASATAIVRAANSMIEAGGAPGLERLRGERESLTAFELSEAARKGDEQAQGIFCSTGRALGLALAGLINILNLPLYVIGGGVAESWDLLAPSLFTELEERSYVYALTAQGRAAAGGMAGGGTQVKRARLGPEAGLLGACILPLYLAENVSPDSGSLIRRGEQI